MKKSLTWMEATEWARDHVDQKYDILLGSKSLEYATVAGYILRKSHVRQSGTKNIDVPAHGIILVQAWGPALNELRVICQSISHLSDYDTKEANHYREVRLVTNNIAWGDACLIQVSSLDSLKARPKAAKSTDSHFPGTCTSCGSPAYIGINIDCSNSSCHHKTRRQGQVYNSI